MSLSEKRAAAAILLVFVEGKENGGLRTYVSKSCANLNPKDVTPEKKRSRKLLQISQE